MILVLEATDETAGPTNEEEPVSKQDYEEKYTDPELREKIKGLSKDGIEAVRSYE